MKKLFGCIEFVSGKKPKKEELEKLRQRVEEYEKKIQKKKENAPL